MFHSDDESRAFSGELRWELRGNLISSVLKRTTFSCLTTDMLWNQLSLKFFLLYLLRSCQIPVRGSSSGQ